MFGGVAPDGNDSNTLWKFDGTNWTWLSGYDGENQLGTYGTQSVAAAGNTPGARDSFTATLSNGKLWVFGGVGCTSAGCNEGGYALSDLWQIQLW